MWCCKTIKKEKRRLVMAMRLNKRLRIQKIVRRINIIVVFLLKRSIARDLKLVDKNIELKKSEGYRIALLVAQCTSLNSELDFELKKVNQEKNDYNPKFTLAFSEKFNKKKQAHKRA
jgi:hypothetical protein